MARHLSGLDHVLIAVSNLDAARATYERLGFMTTPQGAHPGHGTGNHCLMFERDYIELLGLLDPNAARPDVVNFLQQREGGYGLALRTDDAAATQEAWTGAHLRPEAVAPFARTLDDGVELRFENVHLAPAASAGLVLFACRAHDPAALRRPAWLAHPNGAKGLMAATLVSPEPVALEDTFGAIFGPTALTETDHTLAVHIGHHTVLIVSPEDLEAFHPGFEIDLPSVERGEAAFIGLTVAVADLRTAADVLNGNGIPFKHGLADKLVVAPSHAGGLLLEFARAH